MTRGPQRIAPPATGSPTPAIVLGLHVVSLQVARSLGRRGIRVFGIDPRKKAVARHSRFVEEVEAPPFGEELAEYLLRFADRLGCRPVLYPMCDAAVGFLTDHWDRLAGPLQFPHGKPELLRRMVDKSRLDELLVEQGIPHPRTVDAPRGLLEDARDAQIALPFVAKPRLHSTWRGQPIIEEFYGHDPRVLLVDSGEAARRAARLLGLVGGGIWQEFIPGPSSSHVYYAGYRDRSGRIVASFLGRKLRTLPDCLGSETTLASCHNPLLRSLGDRILHQIGYVGAAGIDFKQDGRDGVYKVLEINCRIGLNDGYLSQWGMDIPYIYYLDSQDMPVVGSAGYPDGVIWRDCFQDARWMRLYGARAGISWRRWLREALSTDVDAAFDRGDMEPFLSLAAGEIRWVLRSLFRRRLGRASDSRARGSNRRGNAPALSGPVVLAGPSLVGVSIPGTAEVPEARGLRDVPDFPDVPDVPVIRDCILNAIDRGGWMDDPLLPAWIVRELRILGFPIDETKRLMAAVWQPRSLAGVSPDAVRAMVTRGYESPEPMGGRRRECGDCRSLECVGRNRCSYMQVLREAGLSSPTTLRTPAK